MRRIFLLVCACLAADAQGISITGHAPAVAHVGDLVDLTVQGPSGQISKVWFTSRNGAPIPGRARTDRNFSVEVPPGAVSGPVRIEWRTFGPDTLLTADFEITIYPRLRLRSPRLQLSQGESVTINAIPKDVPDFSLRALQWRADLGQIDAGGRYTAPTVNAPTFARIWACLEPGVECGTTVVEVLPFRLDASPVILNPGESRRLHVLRGVAELAGTWQADTKNISVTADGVVTAGSGSFDGGHAAVTVTTSAGTQTFDLQVLGNGAMLHTAEYFDWLGAYNSGPYGRLPLGLFQWNVAVRGDWIYAFSKSIPFGLIGPWSDSWIDVYRLDANRNLEWMTSVEAPRNNRVGRFEIEGDRLIVTDEWSPGGVTYTWDVSAGLPVLLAKEIVTEGTTNNKPASGFRCSLKSNPGSNGVSANPAIVQENLATGLRRTIPLAFQTVSESYSARAVCTENWAAVAFQYSSFGGGGLYETDIVDLTGDRAEPFAELPEGGVNFSMTILDGLLLLDRKVVEVHNREVRVLSEMPVGWVMAVDSQRKRILAAPYPSLLADGIRVVDLSDPTRPRVSAPMGIPAQSAGIGALGSDFFVLGTDHQGVSVYPIRWESGPSLLSNFAASSVMNDVKAKDGFAFWTGPGLGTDARTFSRAYFQVYDLSMPPYELIASLDRPANEIGWAIELVGNYAYLGTDRSLVVYDVRSPRNPVEQIVIPTPAFSMARMGNFLYVGSNNGTQAQLLVYDITDPTKTKLLSTTPLPEFAYSISAQSGWLAVALGKRGLRSYSLANPAQPSMVTDLSGTYWGVASSASILYTAAGIEGLRIFSAGPTGALTIRHARALGPPEEYTLSTYFPNALAISFDERGIVWISSNKDGRVYGLDVREPSGSRHIAEFPTQTGAYVSLNTWIVQNTLFVAGNLAAFDVTSPQNIAAYEIRQSSPGNVLPNRFSDKPPFRGIGESVEPPGFEHPKAVSLRERNSVP